MKDEDGVCEKFYTIMGSVPYKGKRLYKFFGEKYKTAEEAKKAFKEMPNLPEDARVGCYTSEI